VVRDVFRSAGDEEIPLLAERVRFMKEAAEVLCKEFDLSVAALVERADGSAARLVNLLGERFECFRDEARFEKKTVRFMKRAQIFVADLWAAFGGEGFGRFEDIDEITMFAGSCSRPPLKGEFSRLNVGAQITGCRRCCARSAR
jgi:Potential Queuosine, Q, salvage protein family